MDTYELLRIKMDRIIKMLDNFEDMSEKDFSEFMNKIENISRLIPKEDNEKKNILAYTNYLNAMKFKKYGGIFKGKSIKGNEIIRKMDVEDMVWRINSLLY